MIQIRRSIERGHAHSDWLDTYHTFSFANYYDPRYQGFRSLRVLNEDYIEPSKGFNPHTHKDMEILSYVINGTLNHEDDMGNKGVIQRGDLQYMSAGRGVKHSEFNPSKDELVHFLQIWITPHTKNLAPRYEKKSITNQLENQSLCLVSSGDGREDTVQIQQDVDLYIGKLGHQDEIDFEIRPGRYIWLQVIQGQVMVLDHHMLNAGDGAAFDHLPALKIKGIEAENQFFLFDLA